MIKNIIVILLLLLVAGIIAGVLFQDERETTNIFEVELPVRTLFAGIHEDGGTLFAVVGDEEEFEFSLDGRITTWEEGEERYFYVNATHPEEEGAERIPYGGEEEEELLRILNSWDSSEWEPEDEYDSTKAIAERLIEKLEERIDR